MPQLHDVLGTSRSLAEDRPVTVFVPPCYPRDAPYPSLFCADGQTVRGFAPRFHDAIRSRTVPPIILIGPHSSETHRPAEYIEGVDPRRFCAHEHFFTTKLSEWTPDHFRLCTRPESCGVFGFSNGGAFAMSMSVRHRPQYGVTIAFSIAGGPDRTPESEFALRPIGRFYLSAGTLETPFHTTTVALESMLVRHHVECTRTERHAGHDFRYWYEELPPAVRWAFSAPRSRWARILHGLSHFRGTGGQ